MADGCGSAYACGTSQAHRGIDDLFLEAHVMLTVTFDTILAERADLAALIDTAQREGYDVALVEMRQSVVDPQSLCHGCESVGETWGSEAAIQLCTQLLRITGGNGSELIAETSDSGLALTLSPKIFRIGQMAMPFARGRQVPEEVRTGIRFGQILRLISQGSFHQRNFPTSITPVQMRQLRETASLVAHAHARRDIFVSGSTHAFVRAGCRQALRRLLKTRIMTADEFFACLAKHHMMEKPGRR
jgi:hypothetical protein